MNAEDGARKCDDGAVTHRLDANHETESKTWESDATRFEEIGLIGQGGKSQVWKIFDRLLHRQIAQKHLDAKASPSDLIRFFEEIQITGQLDHPNIVPIYDTDIDPDGKPRRFRMKLIEGETLFSALRREGPEKASGDNLRNWLGILLKICEAISFAHSRGIIHCDLKPANIMVGTHGQVYVMDWGISHVMRKEEHRSGKGKVRVQDAKWDFPGRSKLSGTPAYMAPEQARGETEKIDERTDVFGLGGFLYFLLTFQAPYTAGNLPGILELAASGRIQDPQLVAGKRELPPGLCHISMRALSEDREARYQSVDAFMEAINDFLRGGGWFTTKQFPEGAIIVREGDQADAAYIIAEGRCGVQKQTNGKPKQVCILGAADVFGEMAIFGSARRMATVTALTPVSLVIVTRGALERELKKNSWLHIFVKAVTERFLEADKKCRRLEDELKCKQAEIDHKKSG